MANAEQEIKVLQGSVEQFERLRFGVKVDGRNATGLKEDDERG